MIAYEGPNADQIRYWNEVMGPQWASLDKTLNAQIRPIGMHAIERLAPREDEHIMDIGCGAGETTAEIGRRVGPRGRVLGVDISEPLTEHARVAVDGLSHVEIRVTDAQTTKFEPESFHALFSRFGVMFFADPVGAFANLRNALRPGGRLAFVCWRPFQENPWMVVPAMAVSKHLPLKRPEPNAPGPFAFADVTRVQDILEKAGFVDVDHEEVNEPMHVAGNASLDEAVALLMRLGPAGGTLRDAKAGPELVEMVRQSIREAVEPFNSPAGVVMPSAAWLVTAKRG